MNTLPSRLAGFLDALVSLSDGTYREGGLSVKYPASFDRADLEVIWVCGGVERSEGFFRNATLEDIARFFDQALWDPMAPNAESKLKLAECFLSLVKAEMAASQLEAWYHDGGIKAFLYVCTDPGDNEQWMELFWSVD